MGTRKGLHLQISAIVLCRCHPWGQCNFFECFLSVGFPFPETPPRERLAQLFKNSLNFECLSPVVGTLQVTQDGGTLGFLPGRGRTVSSFKRSRVATVPFFINLSQGGEAFPEGGGWDCCSHSGGVLTPSLPFGSEFTVMIWMST